MPIKTPPASLDTGPSAKGQPMALAVLLATMVGVFYGLTLHPGQDWGGDWALYVSHATNIAQGVPYTETPYFTDQWSHVSPEVYPPVLPLMLAPISKWFGFDLVAFKWIYITSFVATLILAFRCFGTRITSTGALIALLITGLNPFFWRFKESVLSDVPFMAACLLCLCWMQNIFTRYGESPARRGLIPRALLLGLAMYVGYGLREVGLVLPLTALGYELITFRRLTRISLVSIACFGLLAWGQHILMQSPPSDPALTRDLAALNPTSVRGYSHLNFFHFEPAFLWQQAWLYKKTFWGFLCHGIGTPNRLIAEVGRLLTHTLTLLALIGYLRSIFTRITVFELFSAGYVCVILSFAGFHGVRYLIPLFPLVLFYAVYGFQWITQKLKPGKKAAAACGLCLATFGLYGYSFARGPSVYLEEGVSGPAAEELWSYFREHSQSGDIVVSRKPRVVGLMTQLKSCTFPKLIDPLAYAEYFEVIGVDYVLNLRVPLNEELHQNPKLPIKIVDALEGRLHKVFQNDYFELFEYHSPSKSNTAVEPAK